LLEALSNLKFGAYAGVFPFQLGVKSSDLRKKLTPSPTGFFGSLLRPPALSDVRHHDNKFLRPRIPLDDAKLGPRPDDSAVGGNHTMFKHLRPAFFGDYPATGPRQAAILRVDMINPEGRYAHPLLGWVPT
jgi:hypothetical protein